MESVLVTCCAQKEPGGIPEYVPSSQLQQFLSPQTYQRLMTARREITDQLLKHPDFEHKAELGPGPDLGFEGAPDGTLYLPANKRYTGRIFTAANIRELYTSAHRGSILIFSGLYGLTEPEELIRDYNVMMSDSCAHRKRVWRFWRERGLGGITVEYLRNSGCELCHDLLTVDYRRALSPWPRRINGGGIRQYNFPGRGIGALADRGKVLKDFLLNSPDPPVEKENPGYPESSLRLFKQLLEDIDGFLDQVRIRVLIVDDHPPTRSRIADAVKSVPDLSVAGFARKGEEAVEKYIELLPDVVCTNISMPGMDGIMATREIRRRFPDARIFILSVHAKSERGADAALAGAYAFLEKPIHEPELINTIFQGARRKRYGFGTLYDRLVTAYKEQVEEYAAGERHAPERNETVRDMVRILTRKMLEMLDTGRKADLIRFLYSKDLICGTDPCLFLNGADLSRIQLPGAELEGCNLNGTVLSAADLAGAYLERAQFVGIKAENVIFDGAVMQGAVLAEGSFENAGFRGAKMSGADLRYIHCGSRCCGASFEGADLSGADLREADIGFANFAGASLRGADLRGAQLLETTLDGAEITGARGVD